MIRCLYHDLVLTTCFLCADGLARLLWRWRLSVRLTVNGIAFSANREMRGDEALGHTKFQFDIQQRSCMTKGFFYECCPPTDMALSHHNGYLKE